MPQIGEDGQKKLASSSVVVIGAGGLGSPALTYLASAGVGKLKVIDADVVVVSNLNRQFLHNENDIRRPKARSAKETLAALNSDIEITSHNELLTKENAENLLTGYDIVIGAVDSFDTRFVINQTCTLLKTPYIDGGVNGFSGSVFYSYPPGFACLNCIFPAKKTAKEPAERIGVLGVTAGIIGVTLANIAIISLLGIKNPIENKLFLYDGLRMNTNLIDIKKDENCPICSQR